MNERVLRIPCGGLSLVGILSLPAADASADIGVLIIVGGPQYRAGSHRQFTLLARHLAAQGFPVLRFDYRGLGDSPGDTRDFLDVESDIRAAIDALMAAQPELRGVALWGLCDAASAALMYVESTRDSRVQALALLNPWVRSAQSLAKTHVQHYYWRRLRDPAFWRKLLRGGVGMGALRGLARNVQLARADGVQAARTRSFQDHMADGLHSFTAPILLVLSGEDLTAKEFVTWANASPDRQALLEGPQVQRHELPGADHTLSAIADHNAMCTLVAGWLAEVSPSAGQLAATGLASQHLDQP